MTNPSLLDAEVLKLIVKAYHKGYTVNQIALLLEINLQTVKSFLTELRVRGFSIHGTVRKLGKRKIHAYKYYTMVDIVL